MRLHHLFWTAATVIAVTAAATAQAMAGSKFHLEVGAPIAGGFEKKTKNVVAMVRPRLCDDVSGMTIAATAAGLINGERRSVPIDLLSMAVPGVHAVLQQSPKGPWVVALTATCASPRAVASALIPIDEQGAFNREAVRYFERAATTAEIDAALRALTGGGTK